MEKFDNRSNFFIHNWKHRD